MKCSCSSNSRILLSLLATQFLALCVTAHTEKFYQFLNNSMDAFPAWLRENNDYTSPSHFLDLSDSSGKNNVSCGMSNLALTGSSIFDVTRIYGDLLKGSFEISYCPDIIEVLADYDINGTVMGILPVSGSGKATITYSGDSNSYCWLYDATFEIYNFKATPTGFVDLSEATVRQSLSLSRDSFMVTLEKLDASGLEQRVTQMLRDKIGRDYGTILPIKNQTLEYFKHVFATTPISEIVGATTPPPTGVPPESTEYRTRPMIETTTASGEGHRTLTNFIFIISTILVFLH